MIKVSLSSSGVVALTPPDKERCQVTSREAHSPFTIAPRRCWIRCPERPDWVATERTPGADGYRGSMSMCSACRAVFEHTPHNTSTDVDWTPITP